MLELAFGWISFVDRAWVLFKVIDRSRDNSTFYEDVINVVAIKVSEVF